MYGNYEVPLLIDATLLSVGQAYDDADDEQRAILEKARDMLCRRQCLSQLQSPTLQYSLRQGVPPAVDSSAQRSSSRLRSAAPHLAAVRAATGPSQSTSSAPQSMSAGGGANGVRLESVLCPIDFSKECIAHVQHANGVFAVLTVLTLSNTVGLGMPAMAPRHHSPPRPQDVAQQFLYFFDEWNDIPVSRIPLAGSREEWSRGAGDFRDREEMNFRSSTVAGGSSSDRLKLGIGRVSRGGIMRSPSPTEDRRNEASGADGARPGQRHSEKPLLIDPADRARALSLDPTGRYCIIFFASGAAICFQIHANSLLAESGGSPSGDGGAVQGTDGSGNDGASDDGDDLEGEAMISRSRRPEWHDFVFPADVTGLRFPFVAECIAWVPPCAREGVGVDVLVGSQRGGVIVGCRIEPRSGVVAARKLFQFPSPFARQPIHSIAVAYTAALQRTIVLVAQDCRLFCFASVKGITHGSLESAFESANSIRPTGLSANGTAATAASHSLFMTAAGSPSVGSLLANFIQVDPSGTAHHRHARTQMMNQSASSAASDGECARSQRRAADAVVGPLFSRGGGSGDLASLSKVDASAPQQPAATQEVSGGMKPPSYDPTAAYSTVNILSPPDGPNRAFVGSPASPSTSGFSAKLRRSQWFPFTCPSGERAADAEAMPQGVGDCRQAQTAERQVPAPLPTVFVWQYEDVLIQGEVLLGVDEDSSLTAMGDAAQQAISLGLGMPSALGPDAVSLQGTAQPGRQANPLSDGELGASQTVVVRSSMLHIPSAVSERLHRHSSIRRGVGLKQPQQAFILSSSSARAGDGSVHSFSSIAAPPLASPMQKTAMPAASVNCMPVGVFSTVNLQDLLDGLVALRRRKWLHARTPDGGARTTGTRGVSAKDVVSGLAGPPRVHQSSHYLEQWPPEFTVIPRYPTKGQRDQGDVGLSGDEKRSSRQADAMESGSAFHRASLQAAAHVAAFASSVPTASREMPGRRGKEDFAAATRGEAGAVAREYSASCSETAHEREVLASCEVSYYFTIITTNKFLYIVSTLAALPFPWSSWQLQNHISFQRTLGVASIPPHAAEVGAGHAGGSERKLSRQMLASIASLERVAFIGPHVGRVPVLHGKTAYASPEDPTAQDGGTDDAWARGERAGDDDEAPPACQFLMFSSGKVRKGTIKGNTEPLVAQALDAATQKLWVVEKVEEEQTQHRYLSSSASLFGFSQPLSQARLEFRSSGCGADSPGSASRASHLPAAAFASSHQLAASAIPPPPLPFLTGLLYFSTLLGSGGGGGGDGGRLSVSSAAAAANAPVAASRPATMAPRLQFQESIGVADKSTCAAARGLAVVSSELREPFFYYRQRGYGVYTGVLFTSQCPIPVPFIDRNYYERDHLFEFSLRLAQSEGRRRRRVARAAEAAAGRAAGTQRTRPGDELGLLRKARHAYATWLWGEGRMLEAAAQLAFVGPVGLDVALQEISQVSLLSHEPLILLLLARLEMYRDSATGIKGENAVAVSCIATWLLVLLLDHCNVLEVVDAKERRRRIRETFQKHLRQEQGLVEKKQRHSESADGVGTWPARRWAGDRGVGPEEDIVEDDGVSRAFHTYYFSNYDTGWSSSPVASAAALGGRCLSAPQGLPPGTGVQMPRLAYPFAMGGPADGGGSDDGGAADRDRSLLHFFELCALRESLGEEWLRSLLEADEDELRRTLVGQNGGIQLARSGTGATGANDPSQPAHEQLRRGSSVAASGASLRDLRLYSQGTSVVGQGHLHAGLSSSAVSIAGATAPMTAGAAAPRTASTYIAAPMANATHLSLSIQRMRERMLRSKYRLLCPRQLIIYLCQQYGELMDWRTLKRRISEIAGFEEVCLVNFLFFFQHTARGGGSHRHRSQQYGSYHVRLSMAHWAVAPPLLLAVPPQPALAAEEVERHEDIVEFLLLRQRYIEALDYLTTFCARRDHTDSVGPTEGGEAVEAEGGYRRGPGRRATYKELWMRVSGALLHVLPCRLIQKGWIEQGGALALDPMELIPTLCRYKRGMNECKRLADGNAREIVQEFNAYREFEKDFHQSHDTAGGSAQRGGTSKWAPGTTWMSGLDPLPSFSPHVLPPECLPRDRASLGGTKKPAPKEGYHERWAKLFAGVSSLWLQEERKPVEEHMGVVYLRHVIESQGNTQPVIHNLLLWFLVTQDTEANNEDELNQRLQQQLQGGEGGKPSSGGAESSLGWGSGSPRDPLRWRGRTAGAETAPTRHGGGSDRWLPGMPPRASSSAPGARSMDSRYIRQDREQRCAMNEAVLCEFLCDSDVVNLDLALRICPRHMRYKALAVAHFRLGNWADAVIAALQGGHEELATQLIACIQEGLGATDRTGSYQAVDAVTITFRPAEGGLDPPGTNGRGGAPPMTNVAPSSHPCGRVLRSQRAVPPGEASSIRRALWRMVIAFVARQQRGGPRRVLQIIRSSHEDVNVSHALPFLSDDVMMREFKQELIASVKSFGAVVAEVQEAIKDSNHDIDTLKLDVETVRDRTLLLPASKKCEVCGQLAMTRPMTVFPGCGHVYHRSCYDSRLQSLATLESAAVASRAPCHSGLPDQASAVPGPRPGVMPSSPLDTLLQLTRRADAVAQKGAEDSAETARQTHEEAQAGGLASIEKLSGVECFLCSVRFLRHLLTAPLSMGSGETRVTLPQ